MYDPRAPKMLRNMLLFCAVLALLGVAVCAAALFRKDWELLTHMAVLFGLLLAVFLVMAAICWITGRFRVAFSTEGIVYLWGNKAYRTIGYAEVKAVTVCGLLLLPRQRGGQEAAGGGFAVERCASGDAHLPQRDGAVS